MFRVKCCVLFCHLVHSCSVMFSHVESCSVDFEVSQRFSLDKVKFLCLKMLRQNLQPLLPLHLKLVLFAHAHLLHAFYQRGNLHWTMFTRFATSFLLFPHTEQGEKYSVYVQCKYQVVWPGLYSLVKRI